MLAKDSNNEVRNFFMPQADLFGLCDNYKSTSFLINVDPDTEGVCIQQNRGINNNSLQPNTYLQRYLKGSSPTSSSSQSKVKRGKVYTLEDETSNELVLNDSFAFADPTIDEATCTLSGYVKEVLYRVFYKDKDSGVTAESGTYVISDIVADFVIVQSHKVGGDNCNRDDVYFEISQKFGIEYIVARDNYANSMEGIASSKNLQKSGNPGYQLNQPLLVATGSSSSAKDVNVFGFFAEASDNKGNCLMSDAVSSAPAKRLDYGNQLTVSCAVTIDSEEQFRNMCEQSFDENSTFQKRDELKIFSQFTDDFEYLGIYGNA